MARMMWNFSSLSAVEASLRRDEYLDDVEAKTRDFVAGIQRAKAAQRAGIASKTANFVACLLKEQDDENEMETEEEKQERLYIEALNN